MAETISGLTYAEARKLEISKTGLWDMKRRAADGKPLRLYAKTVSCIRAQASCGSS